MNFELKSFLKNLKLKEESISMVLGAVVIVIVGMLVVNYFKDRNASTLPTGLTTANTAKEHVVAKGETLWSVAEDRYGSGYNWVDVQKANNLKSDKIEVGQKLALPEVAAKKPTSTKETLKASPTETVSATSYTVVKGDSLWNIAVKAYGDGYKWTTIAKANKLVNPNLIHAGNVLTLPR